MSKPVVLKYLIANSKTMQSSDAFFGHFHSQLYNQLWNTLGRTLHDKLQLPLEKALRDELTHLNYEKMSKFVDPSGAIMVELVNAGTVRMSRELRGTITSLITGKLLSIIWHNTGNHLYAELEKKEV